VLRPASKRSLLITFRQIALLVETGIDVAEALELVANSCRQQRLKESLRIVHAEISAGKSLSSAVAGQSMVLGDDIAASIQAGEASGRLVEVLRQIAAQLEEELNIRATLSGALAYPAILAVASSAVAAILVWFVLPQFQDSFRSMALEPPIVTQFLFSLAELIRAHVVVIAFGLVGGMIVLVYTLFHPRARVVLDMLSFNSPVLGAALRHMAVGQLFLNLGHLLGNGISLLEAIRLLEKSTKSSAVRNLIKAWEHDVVEGRGLSYSLADFDFLPEGADAMLIMAERTGKLDTVLLTAGAYFRHEGNAKLRQILKLSEPLIIILLGIFVGIVVASVLLPILDVQSGGAAP
jgi:general secretion pathway protein F